MSEAITNGDGANVATLAVSDVLRSDGFLVSPDWDQDRVIEWALTENGMSSEYALEELSPIMYDLRRLSSGWNGHFTFSLSKLASTSESFESLRDRLVAERSFYLSLYRKRPGDPLRVYPLRDMRYFDGSRMPAIACATGSPVSYYNDIRPELGYFLLGSTKFESHDYGFVLAFIQGMGTWTAAEQRTSLRRPWYEIFMERAIQAYEPLHVIGVKMLLRIGKHYFNDLILPRMVRDRYFTRKPAANGNLYELNFARRRVRAATALWKTPGKPL